MFPHSRAKGQLFSEDLLFAMIFVTFLLALYAILASRVTYAADDYLLREQLRGDAQDAAAQLVGSPGAPMNWHQAQVNDSMQSLGLAGRRGVLSQEKAAKFFSLAADSDEYNSTKRLLGLETRAERFNATLSLLNGTVVYSLNATPSSQFPSYGQTNITSTVTRLAVLNGSIVKLTLVVWLE